MVPDSSLPARLLGGCLASWPPRLAAWSVALSINSRGGGCRMNRVQHARENRLAAPARSAARDPEDALDLGGFSLALPHPPGTASQDRLMMAIERQARVTSPDGE